MSYKSSIKEIVVGKQSIIEIFHDLTEVKANGCLQVSDSLIEYFCYFSK